VVYLYDNIPIFGQLAFGICGAFKTMAGYKPFVYLPEKSA
jgi:hypothetical protein